jgi:hypothetical protein
MGKEVTILPDKIFGKIGENISLHKEDKEPLLGVETRTWFTEYI